MYKDVNLLLPEWAWLSGGEHETGGDPLRGRNVLYHVRTATVIEMLEQDMCVIKDGVRQMSFEYVDVFGIAEQMVCVLHYSATLEDWNDKIETIMQKGIEWYKTYCAWEDRNIVVGDSAELN